MLKTLRLAAIVLAALIYNKVEAQQLLLRNFTTADYGGGTQNWQIDISPDNLLLFANNNGLKIYNSTQWETLQLANYSQVRSVMYDSLAQRIYVGGSNEFGYFKPNEQTQREQYHSLSRYLPERMRDFQEIWNILEWRGQTVFQSHHHLFVLNKQRKMAHIATPFSIESIATAGGKLYVASKQGLYSIEQGKPRLAAGSEALRGMTIRAILPYKKHLILATDVNGLYEYDGREARKMTLDITPFVEQNQLFCAAIQGDILAIGTVRNGLVVKNLATGVTQYANVDTGMQNNTVLSMRFDRTGNIWLGLDLGIAFVMRNFPSQYLFGNLSPIGTGYASTIDAGRLYLGTNQGLFSLAYPITNSPKPPTPELVGNLLGQIWFVGNIEGTLFCGSDAGAYTVSGQQVRRIAGTEGTWRLIPLKHHPGLILGCDYQGLFVLRQNGSRQWEMAWRVSNFKESSGSLMEDSDGTIWMSHWQRGIFHLKLTADARRVSKLVTYNSKNGLLVDDNNLICRIGGQIYLSSVDGFHRLNHQTGKLELDERINHIFNTYGQALSVWETPRGDLWAYKPGFLAQAHRKSDGTYRVTNTSDHELVDGLQMGLGHPSFTNESTMMNCERGFVSMTNQPISLPPQSRQILVYEITSSNNEDSIATQRITPDRQDAAYRFEHDFNSLRINFVLPEYMTGRKVEYSCMLEGYDKTWGPLSTDTYKDYTQLPTGKYVFRVRANNMLSGATYEMATPIEILPAWYQTWWAYILYLIAAALLAWLAYLFVRQRQHAFVVRTQREESIKRERQQAKYEIEQEKKEKELMRLKAEQMEYEMKANASKLADSTMNLMRKNDMLLALDEQMQELSESIRRDDAKTDISRRIRTIRHDIQGNIKDDENWEKFEENFNLVYDNYMRKLTAQFPDLKLYDRKLCAYLRMGMSSKEMATLLNTTTRSIETARYRLRKKLQIESGDNLTTFIQNFDKTAN